MTRSLHAELQKIRHTRSQLGLLIAGVAYAAVSLIPPALVSAEEKELWGPDVLVAAVRGPMWLLAVVALLFGIVVSAGELRHRTLTTTSLLTPNRTTVFATKAAAAAVTTATATAIAATISGVGALALVRSAGIEADAWSAKLWTTAAAGVAVVALYATAGVGIGFLARNDVFAVTASLVWVTVVEGVVPIVLDKLWLGDWLPGGLVNRLLSLASTEPHPVPGLTAALMLGAVVAGFAAAGWASLRLRDVV